MLTQQLENKLEDLSDGVSQLNGLLQGVISAVTIKPLAEQTDLVIVLKDIKALLEGGVTCVNKVLDKAEEHLCRTIADSDEDLPYRHERGTVTPSARGFFTISDGHKFMDYLKTTEQDPLGVFMTIVGSKKASSEFFEGILSSGHPLPPGVKGHIIARVMVRKTNNGKED